MNDYSIPKIERTEKNHEIKLINRKTLEISGVKEVDSFDKEEFLLETVLGFLIIRGENLQLINLDVNTGQITIKGKIYEFSYIDEQSGDKAKGFFSKLFR